MECTGAHENGCRADLHLGEEAVAVREWPAALDLGEGRTAITPHPTLVCAGSPRYIDGGRAAVRNDSAARQGLAGPCRPARSGCPHSAPS